MLRQLTLTLMLMLTSAQVPGCTDPAAENYHPYRSDESSATHTEACYYAPSYYCDDSLAKNYAATPAAGAVAARWTCTYDYYGCGDTSADNYRAFVTVPVPSMCQYGGCNDTDAKNYNTKAPTPKMRARCDVSCLAAL